VTTAVEKLRAAQARTGSSLSVGLEPSPEYLPRGMTLSMSGYRTFLRIIIHATRDVAAAYKLNLAFFEALGREGTTLLHEVRDMIPEDCLVIADAKRGDIGTSAQRYAKALYDMLRADAATVNPLMGRDCAEPFLDYVNKLTFFLCLTSNPGADDFLVPGELYTSIAARVAEWGEKAGNAGLVVGATRPERFADVRAVAPGLPILVPGIGAQGGELASAVRHGRSRTTPPGLLFHVTRGILPGEDEKGDPAEIIRAKAAEWSGRIRAAFTATDTDESP